MQSTLVVEKTIKNEGFLKSHHVGGLALLTVFGIWTGSM